MNLKMISVLAKYGKISNDWTLYKRFGEKALADSTNFLATKQFPNEKKNTCLIFFCVTVKSHIAFQNNVKYEVLVYLNYKTGKHTFV